MVTIRAIQPQYHRFHSSWHLLMEIKSFSLSRFPVKLPKPLQGNELYSLSNMKHQITVCFQSDMFSWRVARATFFHLQFPGCQMPGWWPWCGWAEEQSSGMNECCLDLCGLDLLLPSRPPFLYDFPQCSRVSFIAIKWSVQDLVKKGNSLR